MLPCCFKRRKNTKSKTPKVARAKNGRMMLLWKCAKCDGKKLKFIKQQEGSGLLSSLAIKTPFNKFPLLGPLLFSRHWYNKLGIKLIQGVKWMK